MPGGNRPRARAGVALMQILLFAGFTMLFLVAGSQFLLDSLKQGRNGRQDMQLYNVALAGISHGVAWLKRQPYQPVQHFDPLATGLESDEAADTPAADEQLGLAHDYVMDPTRELWARYEVGRSAEAPVRGGVAQAGAHDGRYPDGVTWVAEEVGRQRGKQTGAVWLLRSRGYIYSRAGGKTFETDTGKRHLTLEAEIPYVTPRYRQAALYGFSTSAVTFTALAANTVQLDVLDGTGRPYWLRTATVTETGTVDYGQAPLPAFAGQSGSDPATAVDPVAANQWVHLFGTSELSAIKGLATKVIDLTAGDSLTSPLPTNALTFVAGAATFNAATPLAGSGVLFVDGSLTLDGSATEQAWRGMVVTTGAYTQQARTTIRGGVVAAGPITLEGDTGKVASLRYSQAELELAMAAVKGYRLDYSTLRVLDGAATPSPL